METCPDCGGEAHTGRCRPQVGTMLAEVRLLREFDSSVSDVLLKLADLDTRVRELEKEQKEWH
ncbi:MAG: hypothetical protein HUU17_06265 [Chthonomonadales bacterium]|nr:hypothetical protein [Chthonomonadales bacterium]